METFVVNMDPFVQGAKTGTISLLWVLGIGLMFAGCWIIRLIETGKLRDLRRFTRRVWAVKGWQDVARRAVVLVIVGVAFWVGGTKPGPKGGGGGAGSGSRGDGPAPEIGVGPQGPSRGGEAPGQGRVVFQSLPAFSGGDAVNFTNDILVRTVMLAAAGEAADLATLVDVTSPGSMEAARLRMAREGWAVPPMSAMEAALTAQFVPDQWQVLEVDLGAPVPLASLFFGDTAGRPEWLRQWRGEIRGIVCFDAPPDSDVRAGVANWLALRGGFPGYPYQATHAQRKAAAEAGLNYGVDWATVIIVR